MTAPEVRAAGVFPEPPAAVERAAEAIVTEEGILDWSVLSEPVRERPRGMARAGLAAALDVEEMAKVLAETSRCVWGIADPKHPYGKDCLDDHPDKHPGVGYCWLLPRRQADAIRAALLEGSDR